MSQELDRVINTIRMLCNKTPDRGATEAEAMSALKKVDELMRTYNLTLDKVFLDETVCITHVIDCDRKNRHPVDLAMMGIAEFCDCQLWCSGSRRSRKYNIPATGVKYNVFGMATDTAMVEYLYRIVFAAMETELAKVKKSEEYLLSRSKKTFTTSFQRAMARRIGERLREMRAERANAEQEILNPNAVNQPNDATSEAKPILGSTSLIVLKMNKVQSEFEKLGLKFKQCTAYHKRNDFNATKAGRAAGDKVNLNRPVAGKAALLLK